MKKAAIRKPVVAVIAAAVLAAVVARAQDVAERSVKMADLPLAVQKAVNDYTASHKATVRGLATETEKGKKLFEAEMRVNGKTRDVTFDEAGGIFALEEETAIDQIPAGARSAIEKAATGGRITRVETITEGGKTAYEAQLSKGGKNSEVKVDASGAPVQ